MLEKRIFYIFAATFFVRMGFGLMLSTFPTYILSNTALHLSDYGVISTLSPLAELLTVLFFGVYIDTHGKKNVLEIGMSFAVISMAGISLSNNPFLISPFIALNGVAGGTVLTSSLAMIVDLTEVTNRGKYTGMFDSMNILGWAIGYAIGFIYLSIHLTLPVLYFIASVLSFISLYFISKIVYREHLSEGYHLNKLKTVLFTKDVVYTVLPWFIIYMFIGSFLIYLPVGVIGLKIPLWIIALAIIIGGIGIIELQRFFGHLSDSYGRFKIMIIGAGGFVGLFIGILLSRVFGYNYYVISLIGISGILALAFAPSSLASLGDLSNKKLGGTTMSLYSFVISGGMIIGIPSTSIIYTYYGLTGLTTFFSLAAMLMILLLILKYRFEKSHPI